MSSAVAMRERRTDAVRPHPRSAIDGEREAVAQVKPAGSNQGLQHALRSRLAQAKLTVSRPGDAFEREADAVADAVLRMPDRSPGSGRLPALRSAGEVVQRCPGGCDCPHASEEPAELAVQAKRGPGAPAKAEAGLGIDPTGGRPLDPAARAFFEPRFGTDFGDVRIHTGASARRSAAALNALAYTVGSDIVLGPGASSPGGPAGRHLLAHELTHVVQQTGGGSKIREGPRQVQRLVRTSRVTCTAAASGVASANPAGADRRASALLTNAIGRINAARAARAADPADPDVVAVGNALRTAFRLNPANDDTWDLGAPRVRLPVILRRLEIARDYIDSVVFRVDCVAAGGSHVIPGCAAGTCGAGTEAFTCPDNPTDIVLCPPFWASGANQRGRTWAHEVFHINFGFIDDWGQLDIHNAHCYAQFVALLNGFNSPAGFRCH